MSSQNFCSRLAFQIDGFAQGNTHLGGVSLQRSSHGIQSSYCGGVSSLQLFQVFGSGSRSSSGSFNFSKFRFQPLQFSCLLCVNSFQGSKFSVSRYSRYSFAVAIIIRLLCYLRGSSQNHFRVTVCAHRQNILNRSTGLKCGQLFRGHKISPKGLSDYLLFLTAPTSLKVTIQRYLERKRHRKVP